MGPTLASSSIHPRLYHYNSSPRTTTDRISLKYLSSSELLRTETAIDFFQTERSSSIHPFFLPLQLSSTTETSSTSGQQPKKKAQKTSVKFSLKRHNKRDTAGAVADLNLDQSLIDTSCGGSTPHNRKQAVNDPINEKERYVQPSFMQERGTMCITELWPAQMRVELVNSHLKSDKRVKEQANVFAAVLAPSISIRRKLLKIHENQQQQPNAQPRSGEYSSESSQHHSSYFSHRNSRDQIDESTASGFSSERSFYNPLSQTILRGTSTATSTRLQKSSFFNVGQQPSYRSLNVTESMIKQSSAELLPLVQNQRSSNSIITSRKQLYFPTDSSRQLLLSKPSNNSSLRGWCSSSPSSTGTKDRHNATKACSSRTSKARLISKEKDEMIEKLEAIQSRCIDQLKTNAILVEKMSHSKTNVAESLKKIFQKLDSSDNLQVLFKKAVV